MSSRYKDFIVCAFKAVGVLWIMVGVCMFLVLAGEMHTWWDLPITLFPLIIAGLGALIVLAKSGRTSRVTKPDGKVSDVGED